MDFESRPLVPSRRSLESIRTTTASSNLLPTSADDASQPRDDLPAPEARSVLTRLYISHTLSAWNSRMFEFGAVLFLASIFPGTLLYASIYALVRAFSTVVLSSWLGAQVDRSDRLVAVRYSIGRSMLILVLHCVMFHGVIIQGQWLTKWVVWQRVPVAVSCLCFVATVSTDSWPVTIALFVVQGLLACMEKLAATANTVAVERDWVCTRNRIWVF
jgi:Ferroportin1 (FPN1).